VVQRKANEEYRIMAIIGSDFHGNLKKLDKFMNYKPDAQHVFAGDAVDSWHETKENQLKVLKTLVDSNCILLYGNHELSYHPTNHMMCSGWHEFGGDNFHKYLDDKRWLAAYAIDDYLITHAGLAECYTTKARSAKTAAKAINNIFKDNPRKLYDVGMSRGGTSTAGNVFWYDYRYDYVALSKKYNQVFGHCSLRQRWEEETTTYHHVCVNSDDSMDECWVFDTELKEVIIL